MKFIFRIVIIYFVLIAFSCGDDKSTNPQIVEIKSDTIGNQIWMKFNVDIDHYRNGDPIPQVTNNSEWATLTTGAWCYYNNDSTNGAIYGKLYNKFAIKDPRGFAPVGWHVASDSEWTILTNFIGGAKFGGKLKESGTLHWKTPNTGATNEFGFTALPGGWRDYNGNFLSIGDYAGWWSTTSEKTNPRHSWLRHIIYNNSEIISNLYDESAGFSVRCIKD